MVIKIPDSMKPAFERNSHPYHMWDGINAIPSCLASTLKDNRHTVQQIANTINQKENIHLLGCGSSYFSSMAGTYFFHEVTNMNAFAHQAWEFAAYPITNINNSVLAAISHTGGTQVVLDSIDQASKKGVTTIGLTDVADSALAKAADYVLLGREGREPAIPKTRSYVASLIKHFLLATEVGAASNKDVADYLKVLTEAPKQSEVVINENVEFTKQLSQTMKDVSRVFVLGTGPNVATAYEGALKLQETVHVPTNGWQLEEGMHGPWVSMKENDLVIVIAAKGPSLEKTKKFVPSIKGIGTKVWVITNEPSAFPNADYVTRLSSNVPEVITPLYAILPIYQFAYQLALARGIHPDIMNLDNDHFLKTRLSLPR